MNHFQQQTHVAQQSRREKLRIPGSLHHPSSPQSGNHSDHSAGSASAVLEARPDQGGSAVYANEVLPSVYGQNVGEAYNFTGASELLAYAGKPNGFMGSSGSDILQAGFSNPATVIPKNSNWHGINGQLGHYSGSSNTPLGSSSTLLSTLQGRDGGGGSSMGTYNLSGTNTQAEAMQLYLSGYSGYSDPSSTPMVLISPGTNSTAGAQTGGLIGIPLSQPGQQDGGAPNGLQTESFAAPRGTYNNWRNVGDEFLFLPSSEATQQRKSITNEVSGGLNQMTDEYGRSLSTILGQQQNAQSLLQAGHRLEIDNSQQATAGQHAFQSLSLSLSNQNVNAQLLDTGITSPDTKRAGQKLSDLSHFRTSPTGYANKHVYFDAAGGASLSAVSNSFSFVSGSRYLRAAQQLLDEVCSVGRGIKPASKKLGNQSQSSPAAVTSSMHKDGGMAGDNSVKSEITMGSSVAVGASSPGTGPTAVSSVAPSTAAATAESKESITVLTPEERQENEGKKTKLLAMLQEVDRRYRQYYDQMQVVITSFDAVAGAGAATPYTALALQAMSRYFRCLRDAITGQIQSTCKALGEEDVSKSITSRPLTSRLRFIDQQIRQQRAYQQYGMLQQHAWRPQRGLPERSVSILRAWLFEHFLHPYPKDADKMMLARQTGLTRGQVSNWFINARVRLWKPMVEEMYQEEIKEQEMGAISAARLNQEGDHSKHSHDGGDTMVVIDKMQMEHTAATDQQNYSSDYGMLSTMRKADFGDSSSQLKKSRLALQDSVGLLAEAGMEVDMKSAAGNMNSYAQDTYSGVPIQEGFGDRRYGTFTGLQFNPNAGVSLTLGLRNCDNLQQQIAAAAGQQSFLAGGHNFMGTRTHIQGPHDGGDLCNLYENAAGSGIAAGHIAHEGGIDYQGRKQQHMESHLLHDFVA